jgi:hypothetical protein
MNLGFKTGLLGGAALLALAVSGVPAYAQDDISSLRQQLDAMKERLAKLEADKADKRRVAAAAAVEAGDKPRSWKLPGTNTSMNIGGFAKFHAQYHLAVNTVLTATGEGAAAGGLPVAAVEGSQFDQTLNGGNLFFTARRSRFWIQTWTPTDWGELRTYIEADFAGAGAAAGPSTNLLRLRQAYGTLGPVLIGKTQTLFGGLIGLPELFDDGAPQALGALRIEQIRYTHNFGGGITLSVALEDAGNTSDAGGPAILGCTFSTALGNCAALAAAAWNATTGFVGPQRWPNVTAALQWNFPSGALYVSGMVGMVYVDTGGQAATLAKNDSAFRWGVAAGARWFFGRIEIGGQGGIGEGIGRKYFDGGVTGMQEFILVSGGVTNHTVDLKPILVYNGVGYIQVKLTDTIRMTGSFNWGMSEAASEVPGYYGPSNAVVTTSRGVLTGITNWSMIAHGNLLWNPVPQVTLGVEYSWQFASRYNSANTQVQRIQFGAIYRF